MRSLPLVLVVLAGCGLSEADVTSGEWDESSATSALTMPPGEVAQVLALVNDPTTHHELLNDFIALDRRAATNILAHRAGADARYPSTDDNRFDTLAELDGVAYVGDVALLRLRSWALAHPAPLPETVEGVDFTPEQISLVLWGVNKATVTELDVDVALDGRAATALVNGRRPYATMPEVAAAAYVGSSALVALRSYTAKWSVERSGVVPTPVLAGAYEGFTFTETQARAALALANTATRDALVALGVPATGAAPIVGNRPYTTLHQVNAVSGVGPSTFKALLAAVSAPAAGTVPLEGTCTASNRCQTGLVCNGLSVAAEGICRPSWMAGTFRSSTLTTIPDANAAGIISSIVVSGLATVPEDVIVHLEIDHPRPADLRVVLTQPSSAESIVWEAGSSGPVRVVPIGVETDSSVNGTWTLQVIDTQGGEVGSLRGWSLELTSRWD